jgi:hypothetical protein
VYMGISFIANIRATKAMKPRNQGFDDPTCFAQSAALRLTDPGEQGRDTSGRVGNDDVAPVNQDVSRLRVNYR